MTTAAIIYAVVSILTVLATSAVVNRARQREIRQLQAELVKKTEALASAKSVGDRLLAAHEELTVEGLSPEKVADAIKKQPALVTSEMVLQTFKGTQDLKDAVHDALIEDSDLFDEVINVDRLLAEHGITHDWHKVGDRQIKVPKDKGKGFSHYSLITDMCRRCRMEHQYFRDGGHPSIDDREGFYLGGKRIEVEGNKTPTCLQVAAMEDGSVKVA